MSDITERLGSWEVGGLEGFDELIIGDMQDGAAEIEQLRGLLREAYGMDFATGRISDITHWQVNWMQRVKEALHT